MESEFDFDGAIKAPVPNVTKTSKFKDDPRQPPETGCEFYSCSRTQNLWPWEFDTKTIWLCWPHYRRYRHRPNPYKGRLKHHDFARQHLERSDYPREERHQHREWARRIRTGNHLGFD